MSAKAIYFHEDDYCQIEILPLSLWNYCADEMKKIDEFSNKHATDFGWSEMYMREKSPKSLSEFSISIDSFKQEVEKTLLPYTKVSTGYSSFVEDCDNCFAWGIDEREFVIFAEIDSENLIKHIWLEIRCLNKMNLPNILSTFRNLPMNKDLMIADWKWSEIANMGDAISLENYLALHKD